MAIQTYYSAASPSEGPFVDGDKTKLDGIESGGTGDQTGAEIKIAYEGESNTNAFTDSEKTKLGNQSGTNTGDQDLSAYQLEPAEGEFVDGDKTKLDGIETAATADQTDAEIRAAVDAATDSNVFTDAEKTNLGNQSGTNTGDQDLSDYQLEPAEGAFVDGDKTKLDSTPSMVYSAHMGHTGIANGSGCLGINADPTKFDITDGFGFVLDLVSTPEDPSITHVDWTGKTALSATYLLTNNISFIGCDSSGDVVQQTTDFSESQRRSIIVLGVLTHVGSTITSVRDDATATDSYLAADFARAIGNINLFGNNFNAASTDLTVRKEAGLSFIISGNRCNDATDPNRVTSGVEDPISFIYIYDNGAGGVTAVPATDIDPDNYDDGSGILATVANNKWTNQLCYFLAGSNTVLIRYGNEIFANQSDAELGAETIPPTIGLGVDADLVRTVINIKEGSTDLSNIAQAQFIATGRFGLGSGGGAGTGGAVQDLQDVYNFSTNPEILTDSTRGALSLKRGSAADTDDVLEVLNAADSQVFSVTGEGNVHSSGILDITTNQNIPIYIGEIPSVSGYSGIWFNKTSATATSGNYSFLADTSSTFFNAASNNLYFRIANNTKILVNNSGNVGIGMGANTPSARLHAVSTTEQFRFGYDVSNYWNATTNATGVTTFDAVGSGSAFVFSDNVTVSGQVEATSIVKTGGLSAEFLKADGTVSSINSEIQTYLTPTALTSSSSIAYDGSTHGVEPTLTLGHNATLQTPTNITDGQTFHIAGEQDATGSRSLGFSADYVIRSGDAADIAALSSNDPFDISGRRVGTKYRIWITA